MTRKGKRRRKRHGLRNCESKRPISVGLPSQPKAALGSRRKTVGSAISLDAEADALEFHAAGDEQSNGDTRLSALGL